MSNNMGQIGLISATHLLIKLQTNTASEDDYRRLKRSEEKLILSGFGNFHELQKPGNITKNFIDSLGEKLKNIEGSEYKRLFDELDRQLILAGFDDQYDIAKFTEMKKSFIPLAERYLKISIHTTEETSRDMPVPRQHPSSSMVGILTAINLLYELEMGIISDHDLRKLAEYEERLKTDISSDTRPQVSSKVSQETKRVPVEVVEDMRCHPYTLGTVTNNLLKKISNKLASIKDSKAKDLILKDYERRLQTAGFGDHYGALKIEELTQELEDLRRARGRVFSESDEEACEMSGATSEELPTVIDEKPSDTLTEVTSKACKEVQSKVSPRSSMLRPGFLTAAYLLSQLEFGEASEDDSKKLGEYEERLKLAGFGSDILIDTTKGLGEAPSVEYIPAVGKITHNLLTELKAKLAKTEDQDARDLISDEYEKHLKSAGFYDHFSADQFDEFWMELANAFRKQEEEISTEPLKKVPLEKAIKDLSGATHELSAGELPAEEPLNITAEDIRKVLALTSREVPDGEARNMRAVSVECTESSIPESSKVTADTSNEIAYKDVSEVSVQVINEKKKLIVTGNGAEADQTVNADSIKLTDKNAVQVAGPNDSKNADVVGKKTTGVSEDNSVVQKLDTVADMKVGSGNKKEKTADEARESTSQAAKNTWRLVKLDTPAPPVRPFKFHGEDTSPKDPRITYVPTNVKPERKLVVARRRLQDHHAPIDWFSTENSEPPAGFDTFFGKVYSELPLSCRAYAFSTRLKGINEKLKNVNEPLRPLLRKEYSNVVEAFDRYLNTLQKKASLAASTAIRWCRVQPNQEKWRQPIIMALFMSLDNWPGGLSFRPLNFTQPLTIRASAVAERLKMIEVKMTKANAQQALLLSKEFSEILASFATKWGKPFDFPIPGEPYDDPASRPLPPDLEQLRQDKKRADKEYGRFPSPANKQIRDELTTEFRRRLAIWKDSQS